MSSLDMKNSHFTPLIKILWVMRSTIFSRELHMNGWIHHFISDPQRMGALLTYLHMEAWWAQGLLSFSPSKFYFIGYSLANIQKSLIDCKESEIQDSLHFIGISYCGKPTEIGLERKTKISKIYKRQVLHSLLLDTSGQTIHHG